MNIQSVQNYRYNINFSGKLTSKTNNIEPSVFEFLKSCPTNNLTDYLLSGKCRTVAPAKIYSRYNSPIKRSVRPGRNPKQSDNNIKLK